MSGTHTPRQKRQAQHILISEKKAGRSKSKPEAERVAWAAVNKDKKPKKFRHARKAERVPFAKLSPGDQHRVPLVFDAPTAGKKHEHYNYPVDRKGKLREKGARELPGSPRIEVGKANVHYVGAVLNHGDVAPSKTSKSEYEESQEMSDDVRLEESFGFDKAVLGGNLGHTSSGKPIPKPSAGSSSKKFYGFSDRNQRATSHFSRQDHHDAAKLHQKSAEAIGKYAEHQSQLSRVHEKGGFHEAAAVHREKAEFHHQVASVHQSLANQHQKAYKKMGPSQTSKSEYEESQKMSEDVYDDLLKSVDASDAGKVVISCPHCDEPITKSQILTKAKKAKGAMRGSAAHANTSPHDGGEPGTSVEPARPGAGALENDPGSPRITKAKKADGASCDADSDSDSMSKGLQNPRLVGGSAYVQYVDSGDDKFFSDEIAKGLDRSAFVTKPMDNGHSPSRNRGG